MEVRRCGGEGGTRGEAGEQGVGWRIGRDGELSDEAGRVGSSLQVAAVGSRRGAVRGRRAQAWWRPGRRTGEPRLIRSKLSMPSSGRCDHQDRSGDAHKGVGTISAIQCSVRREATPRRSMYRQISSLEAILESCQDQRRVTTCRGSLRAVLGSVTSCVRCSVANTSIVLSTAGVPHCRTQGHYSQNHRGWNNRIRYHGVRTNSHTAHKVTPKPFCQIDVSLVPSTP